jgi:hypothetical protein
MNATDMRNWLIDWFERNAAGFIRVRGATDTELVLLAFNLNKLAWELAERFGDKAD